MRAQEVFFVIPNLEWGGGERELVNFVTHLDRRRIKPTIVLCDGRASGLKSALPEEVDIIDLQKKRVMFAMPALIALLRARKPDAVMSTLQHLNVLVALCRGLLPRHMKVIVREVSVPSANMPQSGTRWVYKFAYRFFYRFLDLILVQTASIREDLCRQCAGKPLNIVTLQNPVDLESIRKMSRQGDAALLQRKPDTPLWVAVGRLSPEKGFDLLLEAFASTLKAHGAELVIIGEGPERPHLLRVIDGHGLQHRVRLIGFKKNPYPWMAAAELLVSSSRHEGFPNVVLEALALGTPVVATPASGGYTRLLQDIRPCRVASAVTAGSLATELLAWVGSTVTRADPSVVEAWEVSRVTSQLEALILAPRALASQPL